MAVPSLIIGNNDWATKPGNILGYYVDDKDNYNGIEGDFSRASTKTTVNRSGLIEEVATGVASIDFQDNVKGSLLLEPQSTNLITYSEDLRGADWATIRASIIPNQSTSPSGDSNADKFNEDTSLNTHLIWNADKSVSIGDIITYSCYAKKGERDWVLLRDSQAGYFSCYFDLDNGVIGTPSGVVTPTMLSVGNGWYRCSITYTSTTNISRGRMYISPSDLGELYQGDGVSGLYIWGTQQEVLPYATSYIPTNGSAVTRVKDVANNFGDVNTFNSAEGTLFVECSGFTDSAARLISLSDGTNTNRMYIGYSSTFITAVVVVGGGLSYVYNFVSSGVSDTVKIALTYKENDFTLYVNGVKKNFQLSGSIYPVNILNRLSFDSGAGASNFYGETKQLQVYKEALTDAELITLTTI